MNVNTILVILYATLIVVGVMAGVSTFHKTEIQSIIKTREAETVLYKMLYRKYKRKLEKTRKSGSRAASLKNEYKRENIRLRKRVALLEDGYVVSWCYGCEKQVTMLWDLKEDGMTAFCPYCGARMMLCDSCRGVCDYNYGNDTCKEM